MDMELEVDQFKTKNAPSLIGTSIRDSSDVVPTLKSLDASPSRPVFTKKESTVDLVPVDETRATGGLVTDEDDQLANVLDNSGHIKDEAIPEDIKLKGQELKPTLIDTSELHELNKAEYLIDDSNKVTILGGGADNYLAPASGAASNYKYPLKKKQGPDSNTDETKEFIDQDNMRSVDDIINVVNKGDFEKASTLIDERVSETISSNKTNPELFHQKDMKIPEVPTSAIEHDAEFFAPASMREGSESIYMEEQRSRSSSNFRPPAASKQDSFSRPNLARGESIHSGLNDDYAMTNSYDQNSKSLVSERRPRHNPNEPRIPNASSLNYLRSISRSRSRMSNDRKSLADDRLESKELRNSGALINDDAMSNAPDIEYAVNKALDYVDDAHHTKYGTSVHENDDIVKNLQHGLAEVAEEEDDENASNRTPMNSGELLDQLANSAMELMLDEGDENELDQGRETNESDEEKEENKENELDEENEEKGEKKEEKEDDELDGVKEEKEEKEKTTNNALGPQPIETDDNSVLNDDVANIKDSSEALEEDIIENNNVHKDEINEEDLSNRVEHTNSTLVDSKQKTTAKTVPASEIFNKEDEVEEDKEEEDKEEEDKEEEDKEEEDKDEEDKEEEDKEEEDNEKEDNEEEDNEENNEKLTDSAEVQHKETFPSEFSESKITKTSTDAASSSPISAASIKADDDENEINAIIAATAREKALKESHPPLGADGSVYVPKVNKMTFEDEPVYLFTSFAGGFQITTRTNRLVTILTANRIKFEYRDLGTDEEAKSIWRRYSSGKTLPGIIRGKDDYIGNWEAIEEANEDYRVRSLIYETY